MPGGAEDGSYDEHLVDDILLLHGERPSGRGYHDESLSRDRTQPQAGPLRHPYPRQEAGTYGLRHLLRGRRFTDHTRTCGCGP
jgi:hypothetical protein